MGTPAFPESIPHTLKLGDLVIVPYVRESDFAVRQPWNVPERRLLDYLLVYFQEGRCLVRVDGVEYWFERGEFCLVQPGQLVELQGVTHTITPYAHFDVFYNPSREESFATRPGQVDLEAYAHLLQPRLNDCEGVSIPLHVRPIQSARFREALLKMVGVWQSRDAISQLEAQHLATELVLLLLQDYGSASQGALQTPGSLNWVTSFLSLHLAEPLTVSDMAGRARLSRSHFSSLFRANFGMAPHQYLQHLRIHHAQELLRGTDLTLANIAAYCGFADVHHFAKAFKNSTGSTPGRYRKGIVRDKDQ